MYICIVGNGIGTILTVSATTAKRPSGLANTLRSALITYGVVQTASLRTIVIGDTPEKCQRGARTTDMIQTTVR